MLGDGRAGGLPDGGENVLGMDHADDVVERLGIDRIARALGLRDFVRGLLDRQLALQPDHLGARRHDLLGGLLAELEDALEESCVFLAERPSLLALLDQDPDFVGGMEPFMLLRRLDVHRLEQPVDMPFSNLMGIAMSQLKPMSGGVVHQRLTSSG